MPVRLQPRHEYLVAKAELRASARLALRFVETGIAADPDHLRGRRRFALPDGTEAVVESNGDLMVFFHRIDRDAVSLDLVVDIRDLPQ